MQLSKVLKAILYLIVLAAGYLAICFTVSFAALFVLSNYGLSAPLVKLSSILIAVGTFLFLKYNHSISNELDNKQEK